jgi:predicted permease
MMHDPRLAVRSLRATPIVTLVAILSLALGIGANTAMFSLVDSLILRALPVHEPQRLAILTDRAPQSEWWTNPIWEQVRDRRVFDHAFAWSSLQFDLASSGESRMIDGIYASGAMYDTLGVNAMLGRTLRAADDRRGCGDAGPVAVIGYAFWQRQYGGDADAVGRVLTLNSVPFTIVGVTGPEFFGPDVGRSVDVTIPLGCEPLIRRAESFLDRRSTWWLTVMVRLGPSETLDRASALARGVQPQVRDATIPPDWPAAERATYLKDPFGFIPGATGLSQLRQRYEQPLVTILIVVSIVLLVACANIANLLLARATARHHEWSVRLALGASRWRLVRLLLTESLLLSAVGAAFGIVLARWSSQLLVRQLTTQASIIVLDLSIDRRVLAFTTAVTILTALIFGTAPAFYAADAAPIEALKEHTRGSMRGARAGIASGLVVAQVALSVVLVVAAGLFGRTFASLATQRLGFDRERVLVVSIGKPRAMTQPEDRLPLYERIHEAAAAVPGVAHAAVSLVSPVAGMTWNTRIQVSGGVDVPERDRVAFFNGMTPGWTETYGTPLKAGRDLNDRDTAAAPRVALVNEAFARRFLNGANPVGHTLQQVMFAQVAPREIVGLVGDAVYRNIREPVPPTMYVPLTQFDTRPQQPIPAQVTLAVRAASGPPAQLARAVSSAILAVNPGVSMQFRTLGDQVDASLTQERIVAMLSGFFGALALLLAGLGLYGVTSYAVTRRRGEIGIRMALGAAPAGVVRLVLTRVAWLVAIGVAIGIGISAWASQFVASLLFGLPPRDPLTLVAAATTLAAVGAVAGWLPAYRASCIDPAEVLRDS